MTGDLRVITPEAAADAKARMQAIVATAACGPRQRSPSMTAIRRWRPQAGNLDLLAAFDRASRHLGLGPVGMDNPARAGAADVSFIAASVPRAIDGLGLAGTGGHTVNGDRGPARHSDPDRAHGAAAPPDHARYARALTLTQRRAGAMQTALHRPRSRS